MNTSNTPSPTHRGFDRREFRQTYIDLRDPPTAVSEDQVRPGSLVPVLADSICYHLVTQVTEARLASYGASLPTSSEALMKHLERTCRIAGIEATVLPANIWERMVTRFKVLEALARVEV